MDRHPQAAAAQLLGVNAHDRVGASGSCSRIYVVGLAAYRASFAAAWEVDHDRRDRCWAVTRVRDGRHFYACCFNTGAADMSNRYGRRAVSFCHRDVAVRG